MAGRLSCPLRAGCPTPPPQWERPSTTYATTISTFDSSTSGEGCACRSGFGVRKSANNFPTGKPPPPKHLKRAREWVTVGGPTRPRVPPRACEGVGYRGWAHTPEGPTPSVRGSGRAWGLNAKGTCAPVRLCRAGAGVQFLFAGLSSSRATERSSQADARLRTRQ